MKYHARCKCGFEYSQSTDTQLTHSARFLTCRCGERIEVKEDGCAIAIPEKNENAKITSPRKQRGRPKLIKRKK
jgi:hypothetical protein